MKFLGWGGGVADISPGLMNYSRATIICLRFDNAITLKLITTIKIGYVLFRILIANINRVSSRGTVGVLSNVRTPISSDNVYYMFYLNTIIYTTVYVLCLLHGILCYFNPYRIA